MSSATKSPALTTRAEVETPHMKESVKPLDPLNLSVLSLALPQVEDRALPTSPIMLLVDLWEPTPKVLQDNAPGLSILGLLDLSGLLFTTSDQSPDVSASSSRCSSPTAHEYEFYTVSPEFDEIALKVLPLLRPQKEVSLYPQGDEHW